MRLDIEKALSFHKSGKLNDAERLYLEILKKKPKDSGILRLLGTLYLQKNEIESSKKYLLKSLKIDPNNPETLNNLGSLEKRLRNYYKANEYFQNNISKNNYLNSWINKSNMLIEEEKYQEGFDFIKLAVNNFPLNIKIRNNYAIFLFNCGYKNECLEIYRDFEKKKIHFQESYFNYSKILFEIKSYKESLESINKVLFLNEKNIEALKHRFLIYKNLNEISKAEESILLAFKINNQDILTNKLIVNFYMKLKNFDEALKFCNHMINLDKDKKFFLVKKIDCKIHMGLWKNFNNDLKLFNDNDNSQLNISPLSLKYFSDDSFLHKKISENYWTQKVNKKKYLSKIKYNPVRNENNDKIRIGYFSGDFRKHAVFHLIQDLFSLHNRSHFEIYCYSSFKEDGEEREKVIKNVDNFFDIDEKSDEEILSFVMSHSLDIAIDLSGHTMYSKSELFEFDIAKIKVNYLGYPGTMGTSKYDYLIGDKIVTPNNDKKFYFEKILHLKTNYMPYTPLLLENDLDKLKFNLPQNNLILACLCRIEKILPNIFNIWMNILNKHKDIYLALNIRNEHVQKNIKNYCEENGFDFNRLIFLDYIKNHCEYLERMSNFDLCLDTFPYNGHTIVNEALFQSCVPTISLNGKSFASRVSMSLLSTLNLSKLIATNETDYYNKIDFFCKNVDELKKIRENLISYKHKNLDRMNKFINDYENLIIKLL